MWGGRFSGGPAELMRAINGSIGVDKRLWREDLLASRAHAAMLGAQCIIPAEDAAAIDQGLQAIGREFADNGIPENETLEDIHMLVEHRLAELIGPAAGRLHTARSRNDQVATDLRLWVRGAIDEALGAIDALEDSLLDRAEEHSASIMPGFTHLQSAQPVTLGHHLLAYQQMLARDRSRFVDARARLNECPLGSAALAGTAFPIDRGSTASALGFDRPTGNSLDAVSDRDFIVDYLHAAALCSVHLSRLAEEIVQWASQPFGFVILPDAWSTGSSIMPNKRNPDAAELVRGHSARIVGDLVTLLVLLKGLPLAYAKDLQDDKPPMFEAHDLLLISLGAMAGMVRDIGFNTERMRAAAAAGHATATDLADWLVAKAGAPFREAHHIVGRLVALADERGLDLRELPLGWRNRSGACSRGGGGRPGRAPESMMKRLGLPLTAAAALAVAGCGNVGPLQPRPGQPLPVKPLMARATPTPEQLLTPPTYANPERVDELITRSEPRRPDRFDMPPPEGGAAPGSLPAGSDPEPKDDEEGPATPE